MDSLGSMACLVITSGRGELITDLVQLQFEVCTCAHRAESLQLVNTYKLYKQFLAQERVEDLSTIDYLTGHMIRTIRCQFSKFMAVEASYAHPRRVHR